MPHVYLLFPVGRQFISEKQFPECFGPLGLQAVQGITGADVLIDTKNLRWNLRTDSEVAGSLSEVSPITLGSFERAELGILPTCRNFAFCYSNADMYARCGKKFAENSAEASFLKNGAFVYFDGAGSCEEILAVTDWPDGFADLPLQQPVELKPDMVDKLHEAHRFHPVTIPLLVEAHAVEYAWILPGEVPWTEAGGFAYIIEKQQPLMCGMCNLFGSWSAPTPTAVEAKEQETSIAAKDQETTASLENDGKASLARLVAKVSEQLPRGPRICILGGRTFQEESSRLLVQALAKNFAHVLKGRAVIITGGLEGIQEEFATSFGLAEQVVNMVPEGDSSHFNIGTELEAGATFQERVAIYGEIGDVYLTVEGGPGVSKEAKAASDRGAVVLPMIWTGGASGGMFDFPQKALNKPDYFTASQWAQLKEKTDAAPEDLAQSTAKLVVDAIFGLIEVGKIRKTQ